MRALGAVAFSSLFLVSGLSGCANLTGDSDVERPCLNAAQADAIFRTSERFAEDLLAKFDTTFTLVITGTLEGEVDTVTLSYDAAEDAALMQAAELDMRMRAGYYSIASDGEGFYGRDLDPAAGTQTVMRDLMTEDDLGVSFADDLQPSDYSVTCTTLGGADVVEFRYEQDGLKDVMVVEANAPHRPLRGESVDPSLQDDFRVSISYDDPTIRVDTSLPRIYLTVQIEGLSYETVEDGTISTYRIGTDGEWAPFDELGLAVVTDSNEVWDVYDLEPGLHEIDEGYYDFDDADSNGVLSAGDVIEVGLMDGFDFTFWDDWAGELVELVG